MNRHSVLIALVALSSGACLPERFRSVSDAAHAEASRDDVASMPDRPASEAAVDVATMDDVAAMNDVAMDSIEDAALSRPDALADSSPDAMQDALADSSPDAMRDAAVCAPGCTANSACVAGACVARSCVGVREQRTAAMMALTDDEYTIDPDGDGPETSFRVYCADLASSPREYLPVDPSLNLLRTVDSNTRPPTSSNDCGTWDTRWSRVRLLIDTSGASPKYAIDASDFRFVDETVNATCQSGNYYQSTRVRMTNNPYHRTYGVTHACEYRGLNQFFRGNLSNTGFRFPADRVSRYKIENYSSGQAGTVAMWEGAYGYVVAVDAQCGSIVPVEWDRGAPDEPPADADGTPPVAQSSTWRIPIIRAATLNADAPPGSSCSTPIVTAPLGSDVRRSGLFQVRFAAMTGTAPMGVSCQSSGLPAEAVWLSVEVPAMSQRRLVAESRDVDPAILRVVDACGGDCLAVSAPSSVPASGTTFVILDNRSNPMPRTFYVAASSRSAASRFGTSFMTFVVQRVDAACHAIVPGSPGALTAPTLNSATPSGRRLTLDWSLGTCATGAYVEVCRDASCATSYCRNGSTAIPCSYHIPAMSPRFDVNFRESGTYFVRMRSLRFWMPGAGGEPVYGSEVLSAATTPQMVNIP